MSVNDLLVESVQRFFRKVAFEMRMSSRDEIIQSDFLLLLPPPLVM